MVLRDLSQQGPSNRGGSYVTEHHHETTPSGHTLFVSGPEGAVTQVRLLDHRYSAESSALNSHSLYGPGPCPTPETTALLALLGGAVTVPCGDSLDFAVALDWYNKIVDGGLGEHTPLADLVHRGKYWYESPLEIEKLREVGLAVVHEMVTFIGEHPLLRTMDTIAAVPGHDAKVVSFGSRVAAAIARELGIPLIACGAHQEFRAPAKSLEPSDRARALAGQFHCHVDVSGKRVLIVDDVYGSGATVEETARALRAAGSNCLAGIAAVRTMKSC